MPMMERTMEMKKLIALLLVLVMVFSLVACGAKEEPKTEEKKEETSAPATEEKKEETKEPAKEEEKKEEEKKEEEPMATVDPNAPVSGGILYMSREGNYQESSLFPHMKQNTQTNITMSPAIEKLFNLDAEGNMVPWLAKSWDVSDDKLTWTFHLEEGVKFHDGSDFNAEVAMWNMQMGKDRAAETTSTSAEIASMRVIDEYTLEITFNQMYAVLMLTLDNWMVSQKAYEEKGEEWLKLNPVGTGPFVFDHWTIDSEIVYVKNENYWKEGQPYLDGITFKIIQDPAVLGAAVKNGEVDIITGVGDADLIATLDSLGEINKLVTPGDVAIRSLMPCGKEGSPLADTKVRQALAYALDFEAIVASVFDPELNVSAGQTAGPNSIFYSENVNQYPYDPDKARELLAEAGYGEGGETLSVEIILENIPSHGLFGEACQAYLLDVGVDCTLTTLDGAAYVEKCILGEWEEDWIVNMATTFTSFCPLTGVNRLLGANHGKFFPWVYFPDEWVDNITTAAAQATLEEAVPYYQAANEAFFNDYCGFIGVVAYGDASYTRNTVHGYDLNDQISFYGGIWKEAN